MTTTSWRRTCSVALVAAPALTAVSDRVSSWVLPADYDDGADALTAQLGQIHAHDGLWRFDAFVALATGLALVAATLGLVRLTRPGAPRLTAVTTAVLLPAAVGTFAHGVFYDTVFGAMSRVPDPSTMAPFVAAMEAYPPFRAALVIVILGTVLGLGLACFALWRSRVVRPWVAALAAVYPVAELLSLDGWWSFAAVLTWLVAYSTVAKALWCSAGSDRAGAGERATAVQKAA